MNEYEVVIKTSVNRVYIIDADSPEEAQEQAERKYEGGHEGDSMSEYVEEIRVERP